MSAPLTPLLRLTRVTKRFGLVAALRNLSLSVYAGEFLSIFGPNGAGKTTLLRIVASLISPSSGVVEFPQDGSPPDRRRVGFASHQTLLYNELTGLENLQFYGRLYGLQKATDRGRQLLRKMDLEAAGGRMVREYSRGMKQRLTLARALLHEPELLLLDEPYTGLDQHGNRLLTGILRDLKKEDRTILLVTHNWLEGLTLCDRALIQHRGSVAAEVTGDQLGPTPFEALYLQTVGGATH